MSDLKRIAVLTSGGDSPGMNAAIRAVTRAAIYSGMEVIGVQRGYEGLLEGDFIPLEKGSVGSIIHRGGTFLRTARSERFRTEEGQREALTRLEDARIDGLVVIGGEGSYKGAWELHKKGFPVIGLPGTIDNDIAGTDETIGFDTAVNTGLEAVQKLRDTASSHDRLFIVEVMGRHTGFLALEVGAASGAEAAIVPEIPFSLGRIIDKLHYSRKRGKTHSMIILAEGVMPAQSLKEALMDTGGYEARVTVLGHVLRGGSPTSFDTVLASRMGIRAVQALSAGERGKMVGVRGGKMRTAPLPIAWEEKKCLNPELLSLIEILSI
ncbi:MAG: 6-phosphofructokinase [Synergistales bacterium]|jgi:6-phosphofructokinase 1